MVRYIEKNRMKSISTKKGERLCQFRYRGRGGGAQVKKSRKYEKTGGHNLEGVGSKMGGLLYNA